jgi:hypothetical protein
MEGCNLHGAEMAASQGQYAQGEAPKQNIGSIEHTQGRGGRARCIKRRSCHS